MKWVNFFLLNAKLFTTGLQQCQEIQQLGLSNQEKANFWTCSICYEVGGTYDSADAHLTSMEHIRNYMVTYVFKVFRRYSYLILLKKKMFSFFLFVILIWFNFLIVRLVSLLRIFQLQDECECDEKETIEKECQKDECLKYERYRAAAEQIFKRDGGVQGLQPPSILRMTLNTDEGKKKFGIENETFLTFHSSANFAERSVLHCSVGFSSHRIISDHEISDL